MIKKETSFEKIERNLFKSHEDALLELSPKEMEVKERLMFCVSKKMDDPLIEDSDLVNQLMSGSGGQCARVSQSQAYRDVAMVTRLVGNVQLAAKNWYRYMIIEGAKKAYGIAISLNDAKAAAACVDKIGKYTRADKEDDGYDWDQMIAPSFEPSDDITLLEGMVEMPNLETERSSFRSLFKSKMVKDAVDIQSFSEEKKG